MTLALNALQKAIYDRLTAQLGGTPVYNHVPQASAFPYVVIGEKTSLPWRGKGYDGQEVTVTLHVWSSQAGDKECATLMQAVYAALDRQETSLTLPGYGLVEIACEFTQLLADTGEEARPDHFYHGVVRFRATVQDA